MILSVTTVDAAVRNALFARYVEPRLAAIRRSVGIMTFAGEDADDNLQEVLLHLLEVIHQYDPAQTAPSTWIARVVSNFMHDIHSRQAARRRREPEVCSYDAEGAEGAAYSATRRGTQGGGEAADDAAGPGPDPGAPAGALALAGPAAGPAAAAGAVAADFPTTYGALMRLSARRRGILLRHAAGHSVAEIAAALACQPGAVSTALYHAKAQMRQFLAS